MAYVDTPAKIDPWSDHYGEVEHVPPIFIIYYSLNYDLYHCFERKNYCENKVDPLHDILDLLWFIVPADSHKYGVEDDGHGYSVLKYWADGDIVHVVFQVAALWDVFCTSLGFVAFGHRVAILYLQRRQQMIAVQLLLLDVEVIDDHTDKQIQQEKSTNNHAQYKEQRVI